MKVQTKMQLKEYWISLILVQKKRGIQTQLPNIKVHHKRVFPEVWDRKNYNRWDIDCIKSYQILAMVNFMLWNGYKKALLLNNRFSMRFRQTWDTNHLRTVLLRTPILAKEVIRKLIICICTNFRVWTMLSFPWEKLTPLQGHLFPNN